MSKMDKLMETRMSAMLYMYNLAYRAKEAGYDAVDEMAKEIKMRGVTKIALNVPSETVKAQFYEMVDNIYANMMTCNLLTLHDVFGFGRLRLKRFKTAYDNAVKDATDLDYLGEHYVSLADYAEDLNARYDTGLDPEAVRGTQKIYDEKDEEHYHMAKIERVIECLDIDGFQDAAEHLRKQIGA